MYYKNVTDLIGNTPLVKVNAFKNYIGESIYLKIEKNNLSGSIKDRYTKAFINEYKKKELKKPLIIPTSGNLGISFASICCINKLKCIIVMPEDASAERKKIIKILGARLIETPAQKGMMGAIAHAKDLAKINDYFYVDQFSDLINSKIHSTTTAKEIETDLNDEPDYIIAGLGSSGTVSGLAKYYQKKKTKIIAVLPKDDDKIPGIGPGFLPSICDLQNISEIVEISSDVVNKYIPYLIKETGILLGKSGSASLLVGLRILKSHPNKKVVVIIPDSYERYLSDE